MPFDYQWTAPNGIPIVVQTIKFPDGQRQLVGVYSQGNPAPLPMKGSGWGTIAALITDKNGGQVSFSDTAANFDFYTGASAAGQAAGRADVVSYFDGPASMMPPGDVFNVVTATGQTATRNAPGDSYAPYTFSPGWYRRAQSSMTSATSQAWTQAYQWGQQQLASMGTTASSVSGNPGAGSTVAQNVPPPAPGAAPPSHMMTYLLLAGAAAGAWFLLKPSSSSSSSAVAA
jgi:hypothetical protein